MEEDTCMEDEEEGNMNLEDQFSSSDSEEDNLPLTAFAVAQSAAE